MANVALLQGKKVLVTGAARGLGRDFAQAIAEAGAQVVMADILDDLVQKEQDHKISTKLNHAYSQLKRQNLD